MTKTMEFNWYSSEAIGRSASREFMRHPEAFRFEAGGDRVRVFYGTQYVGAVTERELTTCDYKGTCQQREEDQAAWNTAWNRAFRPKLCKTVSEK